MLTVSMALGILVEVPRMCMFILTVKVHKGEFERIREIAQQSQKMLTISINDTLSDFSDRSISRWISGRSSSN